MPSRQSTRTDADALRVVVNRSVNKMKGLVDRTGRSHAGPHVLVAARSWYSIEEELIALQRLTEPRQGEKDV